MNWECGIPGKKGVSISETVYANIIVYQSGQKIRIYCHKAEPKVDTVLL